MFEYTAAATIAGKMECFLFFFSAFWVETSAFNGFNYVQEANLA
jgi:hypothetical protein